MGPIVRRVTRIYQPAHEVIRFSVYNENQVGRTVSSPDPYNDEDWHHIVGTFDGTTVKVYVDGNLKNDILLDGFVEPNGETDLVVGSDLETGSNNSGPTWRGYIDELSIWSVALTDAEVLQMYQNP